MVVHGVASVWLWNFFILRARVLLAGTLVE